MKFKKTVCTLSIMLCLFGLTGCYSDKEEMADKQMEKVLEGHTMISISDSAIVDKKTKVIYFFRGYGMSPLLNSYGTPVLFDGDLSLYQRWITPPLKERGFTAEIFIKN